LGMIARSTRPDAAECVDALLERLQRGACASYPRT